MHCIKYSRVRVFTDPHSPVERHNRRFCPYAGEYELVLIRENTSQWKPVFSHILCSVIFEGSYACTQLSQWAAPLDKQWTFRSSHRSCSVKKDALKSFAKFTGKHLCWSLFLNKVEGLRPATILKKTLTQVISCDYCEIFKNTYFKEHLRTAAFQYLISANQIELLSI